MPAKKKKCENFNKNNCGAVGCISNSLSLYEAHVAKLGKIAVRAPWNLITFWEVEVANQRRTEYPLLEGCCMERVRID